MAHPWAVCKPCQGRNRDGSPCRKFAHEGDRFCSWCYRRVMAEATRAGYFCRIEEHGPPGPPMRMSAADEAGVREDAIRAMEDKG